ncbi:myelin-associated glycoprotein-like isoform X2 [Sardina pilchardus]|uniref:myelin-associated glycoprotein-like isoform X2 n=1 Tax=Sardina pilchardus TaxID=27697 RepID=UPI002E154986
MVKRMFSKGYTGLVMDCWRLLGLFAVSFTACLLTTAQGFHIQMPDSVRAVEGSCILVPCQTQPHTRVVWYKYQSSGWPAIYDRNNPGNVIGEFKGRTTVLGRSSEGNCTLRINNVKMSDGIKLFPYINPESNKYYKPTIQIKTQARTHPEIRGPESPVKEGEVFSLSCSVQHSCPPSPPAIEWRGLTVDTTEVSTESNDNLWVDVSTVTVTAAPSQHGKKVHCRTGDMSTESRSLTVNITFAPIDVKTSTESSIIAEHGNINLKCNSKSNPRPELYQWLITNGSHFQVNTSSETITITDVQKGFSAACIAHNAIGAGRSAETSVDVAFVYIMVPNSSCSETGGMLRCVCQVEAQPESTVTWMFNGSANILASVIPAVTTTGNLKSSEVVLEGKLAEHGPVVCVAANSHRTVTHQMTLQDAKISLPASFPWIILGCAFGCFSLCGGLICFCRYTKNSSDGATSSEINKQRPKEEQLKARARRARALKPEDKLCNNSKMDNNVCRMEMDPIYDNDPRQEEDIEDIYINDAMGDSPENIYLNS